MSWRSTRGWPVANTHRKRRWSIAQHNFYELKPLEEDDIDFAWTCPEPEHGGCFGYELRRQIAARIVWRPKKHYPNHTVAKIKSAWVADFSVPWSRLPLDGKKTWIERYKVAHVLPFWPDDGEHGDPKPDWPGDIYLAKIDWDLSDAEILTRIKRAIPELRPRDPVRKRTETAKDQLTAIAAQRIIDCKGDLTKTRFVEELTVTLGRENLLFSNEYRLTAAARRYRHQESEFEAGTTKSGAFDIAINPAAYGRSSSNL